MFELKKIQSSQVNHHPFRQTRMSVKKHIMLSYQWDNQEVVTEVYRRLSAKEIPLWMDIQGGMKGHLSERYSFFK